MAATWPVLLLLLPAFNPLLSMSLPGQNTTDNGSRVQPTAHPLTPRTEDKRDDTFFTVTTEGHDNSSRSTDQGETRVTENERRLMGSSPSTERSTAAEAVTEETAAVATTRGSTLSWNETSTAPTEAADSPGTTDAPKLPAEDTTTAEARTETAGHVVVTTGAAESSTASTQDPEPSTSGAWSTTNATGAALGPRMNRGGREDTTTAETGTETAGHVVTTEAAESSTASTQDPEPSTSGASSTTNATGAALVPRMNPGGRVPVPEPPEVTPPTTAGGDQGPKDDGRFLCPSGPLRKDGLVSQCLIAIATLAGVATIFIVSTTVLCTKLSSAKYRYRMDRVAYGTEMVCISSLLPDGNGPHSAPRRPRSNGALLPNLEDDEGDDLTLHSFLPETDRGSS
ncbi:P-selectin glycoprotein ligand 1 [Anguilla anguilla]|uniref:P-selectin glycoprotein ligand 1 n=1 Tax=Anguilla anguilla TaxID=7936 RepID=UPI0015B21C16|nr:P-selectin glycoprotein ligand 1 [Anguilla anguilla]XP_035291794.1 P-selectin glycoprotein ligand 1 [Anguilla anguilla]